MKSLALKFIAIILAALCLMVLIGSAFGLVAVSAWEMDATNAEQIWKRELWSYARDYAYEEARHWATNNMSTAPQEAVGALVDRYFPAISYDPLIAGVSLYSYTLRLNGEVVGSGGADAPVNAQCWEYSFTDIMPTYQQVHEQAIGAAFADVTQLRTKTYDGLVYHIFSRQDLTFQVDVVLYQTGSFSLWDILKWVWDIRNALPFILAGSGLLLAVCLVYLCWAAGKKKGREEIRPGGLNRLPLDLYAAADCFLGYLGLMILTEGVSALMYSSMPRLALVVAITDVFILCLAVVAYVFCFAAQVKQGGFWWRRSVIGFCLLMIFRATRWCWRALRALFRLLPVIWQWLLTAAGMVIIPTLLLFMIAMSYDGFQTVWILIFFGSLVMDVCVVLYGGYCFGILLNGAKEMAKGNLDHKVSTKSLLGAFHDCGENLNSLSQAAMVAAQQQMKADRMKTELIANVSHDIKTPLTSIINYVDLLQKPHSDEEEAQYLDVLSRQSQRLKKLTEDLVEMSKASTGNITAELTQLDACETVRQALGEFADKLDAVPLHVVFRQPQEPVIMHADGRLSWRVLSNLLSNAVKYAQPGTRLYVDVTRIDNRVLISLKNMSREELNVTADELMERFVRGDASRHTEGSGLGLNIAKGLMETQGGALHLFVDGDLFKVTLFFPAV